MGCSSTHDEIDALLANGQVPEAVAASDAARARRPAAATARHALSLGLTRLAAGDEDAAAAWLNEARRLHKVAPSSLSTVDAARLHDALAALGLGW